MATYNQFELAAMMAPDDNWGYQRSAAASGEEDDGNERDFDLDEETVPDGGPVCPGRYALVMDAPTAGAMMDALRSHSAECAACGCSKKEVMTDRELLDANAVCCEIREAA